MPVDDTKSFDIQVIQQFPVFRGVSIPGTTTLFQTNPLVDADYQKVADWGCNCVYLRLMWGGGCAPESDEYAVGDPETGANYNQTNMTSIQTQVTRAKNAGLFVWMGMQNSYGQDCPPPQWVGWSDFYSGDFINLNTQPNHCSTGVQTPMPGRDRYLNLLQYLCHYFNPDDVGIIPWDFPYHNDSGGWGKNETTRHNAYYLSEGTQDLMVQRIRQADDAYWLNKQHPRYIAVSPLCQGVGYEEAPPQYQTPTADLARWQQFYEGDPYIYYGFDSHGGGWDNGWPLTSAWGSIVIQNYQWDYDLTHYDIMWRGVPTFQQAHPMAKVMCWEWIGLGCHYPSGSGGCGNYAGIGDRPMSPARMNWAHSHFNKARLYNASYTYFDWWGRPQAGHPSSCASPTEGGGAYEVPTQTQGADNALAYMLRYHNTYQGTTSGDNLWSDNTYHSLPQNGQSVPVDYDHWVNP